MQRLESADPLYDRAVEVLREAVLSGVLQPGQLVSAPQLAVQLGISRTPVREAILQLQREGLVTTIARRGVLVLGPSIADLEDIFQFREPLEGAAAALAAERISLSMLNELSAAFEEHVHAVQEGNLENHLTHDEAFHSLVARASRNRRINDSLFDARSRLRIYTRELSTQPGAMDETIVAAHLAILNAIQAGDAARASSAARKHVRGVYDFYLQHLNALPAVQGQERTTSGGPQMGKLT